MELIEELNDKREKCNIEAEKHKAARNKLNDQTKHWVGERDRYNSQTRGLIETANGHRSNRDRMNSEVKNSKSDRDIWNRKVNELAEALARKKREKMPKKGPSISQLRKKLRALEFQQMTSVLTADKEKNLIDSMSTVQNEIKSLEEQIETDEDVKKLIEESREAREKAEHFHQMVGELADKAQSEHDEMMKIYVNSDATRKEADSAQEQFIKTKMLADEEHRKHIEFIRQVHDYDKIIAGIRQKSSVGMPFGEERTVREEAVDIYERFKSGEKLSTEDLMTLQKSGYL